MGRTNGDGELKEHVQGTAQLCRRHLCRVQGQSSVQQQLVSIS